MIRRSSFVNHIFVPWQIVVICLLFIGGFVQPQKTKTISDNYTAEVPIECGNNPEILNCLNGQNNKTQPTPSLFPSSTGFPTKIPSQTPTRAPQKQSPTTTKLPNLTPRVTTTVTAELTPDTGEFPVSAKIDGVRGYAQSYPLDCESRSAVDLAAFFGVNIDELGFQSNLPVSDDPEEGFVGNFKDPSGKTPPESYGVHAPPVAKLLRYYGLNAHPEKFFTWEDLQRELISGHPVMVWVVNNPLGKPITYTVLNGNTTVVARFEHTVLVTGYHSDYVYLQNGSYYYAVSKTKFLKSWSILQFMAVRIGNPPLISDSYENKNSRLIR